MGSVAALIAMELRHNDEPLGRVCAGAVDIHDDLPHADARFWFGVRAMRSRVAFCGSALPGPGAHILPLVIR